MVECVGVYFAQTRPWIVEYQNHEFASFCASRMPLFTIRLRSSLSVLGM